MKKVLLDTSFILSCIREKVDFFEWSENLGFRIVVPSIILDELKKISITNKSSKLRGEAEFALRLIKSESYIALELKGRYADVGLISYLKKNPDVAVATLDREIKKSVINRKIVLRARKKLEFQ